MFGNKKPKYFQVAQSVWGLSIFRVNIFMIANRRGQARGWVLVDTGLKGSAGKIIKMAESLFGPGTRPQAIVLTHGHFDHAGALEDLLRYWPVPVYAHRLELPYLTGQSAYPPADPAAGGGLVTLLSVIYPVKAIDLGNKVSAIDMHEGIPELPEWRVLHTPGHTPGHISLFFPLNTTLIAGDALSTTRPGSALYMLGYLKKLSGPPVCCTTDWVAASGSVKKLAALEPRIIAAGHGQVLRGRELQAAVRALAYHFEETAVPHTGRYAERAAIADENGVKYVPPFKTSPGLNAAIVLGTALITFLIVRKL